MLWMHLDLLQMSQLENFMKFIQNSILRAEFIVVSYIEGSLNHGTLTHVISDLISSLLYILWYNL